MTNYKFGQDSPLKRLPEIKEMPLRTLDEKRKKRLALFKRIEWQRGIAFKNWLKKHTK